MSTFRHGLQYCSGLLEATTEPGRPDELCVDTIWLSPDTPPSGRSYFPAQRSCPAGCSRDNCSVGSPGDTDLDRSARRVSEARFESSGALSKALRPPRLKISSAVCIRGAHPCTRQLLRDERKDEPRRCACFVLEVHQHPPTQPT